MPDTVTHVRFIVEIKQVKRIDSEKSENVVVKETPTEHQEYNRCATAKEYVTRIVPHTEVVERSIYRQEVDDLNVHRVIESVLAAAVAPR